MSTSRIPASGGGGYARYLEGKTVAPERGDYYPTPDGEMTQAPGRWLAEPDTLERLGVKSDGPVERGAFIALMEGRHPGTGRWLRPEGAGGGRGGGIDVTFSAPKSVSVVWALADPLPTPSIPTPATGRTPGALSSRIEHDCQGSPALWDTLPAPVHPL